MTAVEAMIGLCSTCNNAPGCFHRASRGPALFCELFDDSTPAFVRSLRAADWQSSGGLTQTPADRQEVPDYAGLCINCRHRVSGCS